MSRSITEKQSPLETDAEFLKRVNHEWLHDAVPCVEDWDRLFALARRGAEAAARIEQLEKALRPFAGIKADDGDDFSKWPDQVIIKCEVSVREIKAARAALEDK